MSGCPYCRVWVGSLRDLLRASGTKQHPAAEHGHRLWTVTTASNVYLFRAPARFDLDALVRRTQRSRQAPRYQASLTTTAGLQALATMGDHPQGTW